MERGIKQGCPLAMYLYIIYHSDLVNVCLVHHSGFGQNSAISGETLSFASYFIIAMFL